jgi:hypothetical protein
MRTASRSPANEHASADATRRLAKKWLNKLPIAFDTVAREDVREHLRRGLPRSEEEDKVSWILTSDTFLDWVKTKESQVPVLLITLEEAPNNVINCLSFTSAFVVRSLRTSYSIPVLYHSCGLRSEDGYEEGTSDAVALVNSLNAQLIKKTLDADWGLDLSLFDNTDFRRKSQTSLRRGLKLLRRLVQQASDHTPVIIVVDSLSRLSDSDDTIQEVAEGISRVAGGSEKAVKVLLTDALPGTFTDDGGYVELFVPERVDGGGRGLNLKLLREDTQESIEKLATSSSRSSNGETSSED